MSITILPEHANALSAFDHVQRTRLVFGNGSAGGTGGVARKLGLSHILLVTDSGLVKAGHVELVSKALEKSGVSVTVFDEVIENPTTDCVENARQVAATAGVDSVSYTHLTLPTICSV